MKKTILAVLMVTLAGCATTDPYTGEQKTSNAGKGAAIGAIGGAVLGAMTSSSKDREKGILIGAAAGAAIGGGVGAYMDKQETELRQELQGTGVQVVRNGDQIELVMPGNITFDTNVSSVKADFYPTLTSVAKVIDKFDETLVLVEGHTDSTGSMELNQRLSEERASSVGRYLIGQGVAASRIQTQGYGPRYPIADNATPEGRAQNRRVEIQLYVPSAN